MNVCGLATMAKKVNWKPPSCGVLKSIVDGSFDLRYCKSCICVIARNEDGKIVDGFCGSCSAGSRFMSEALALRLVVFMAKDLGCGRVILESDCLLLVKAVKDCVTNVQWDSSVILEDIIAALGANVQFSISFVGRMANRAVDWLANVILRGCILRIGCLHPIPSC